MNQTKITVLDLLSLENEVFRSYIYYSSLLIVKVFLIVPLIAIQRIKYMQFANLEDTKINLRIGPKPSVSLSNDNIERVRRAHLNDLENIPFFILAAFFYILTNPDVYTATTLFKIVTLLRFLHTFVYVVVIVPQPARFITFFIPYLIMFYMSCTATLYFWDEKKSYKSY